MEPLDGIRIVEMAVAVQGPGAGGYLADMGADVIKIEPPWGDANRYHRGAYNDTPAGTPGTQFIGVSHGKRSIALDVHTELGRRAVYRLIESADVFLSNFREGALERMGMGYAALSARNERLIYAIANGFGHEGPAADKRMSDQFAQSRSGIAGVTGEAGGRPIIPGAIIGDTAGALQLAMGILLGLVARDRHGVGQRVATSAYGALIWMQAWEINHSSVTGRLLTKEGPHHPNVPGAVGIYETADGAAYCVGWRTDAAWEAFCSFGGIPEVLDDPRWQSVQQRSGLGTEEVRRDAELLRPHVARAFRNRTDAEWAAFFETQPDITEQRVLDYEEILNDEQALANGYIVEKEIPYAGRRRVVGIPIQLSRTPGTPKGTFAALGQHTAEIMAEAGFSADEIQALKDETEAALVQRYMNDAPDGNRA